MAVAQCFMLGRIGMDFCSVKADPPQLEQPHLLSNGKNLYKHYGQLGEKALAECSYRVMVRMGIDGYEAEGDRVIGGAFQLATGKHTGRVAIKQECHQHSRMIWPITAASIRFLKETEVKLLDNFNNETGKMLFRQPVLN